MRCFIAISEQLRKQKGVFKISKGKAQRKAQNKYNYKMACEKHKKLLELNFEGEDTKILCLTHSRRISRKGAAAEFKNYIRRLNYRLNKAGRENVRYIAISEHEEGARHYLFIKSPFSDTHLMNEWKCGSSFLMGADTMGDKLREETKHKKRWISSIGLLKK